MAATLGQIREALAVKLGQIGGVQVQAYLLSSPTPPTVWVFPGGPGDTAVEYHGAMGNGLNEWQWTVQAFVGLTTDKGAQMRLDEMLAPAGADSVKERLEALEGSEHTVTLGGLIDDLTVVSATGYRVYTLAGAPAPVLGCEWFVEVMATGN